MNGKFAAPTPQQRLAVARKLSSETYGGPKCCYTSCMRCRSTSAKAVEQPQAQVG